MNETKILKPTKENIKICADAIAAGEVVAFPTETVYGLGANGTNEENVKKIFTAKGRPSDNPLILHIASIDAAKQLCKNWTTDMETLAKAFWPGPFTMVVPRSEIVPDCVCGGLDTVGIRMPNNDIALELIKQAKVAVAAPSANTSSRPSPTSAKHVYNDLNGKIPYILDGGATNFGIESTVFQVDTKTILRPGSITKNQLENIIGKVEFAKQLDNHDEKPAASPGMKYKHYAPKVDILIVEADDAFVQAKEIISRYDEAKRNLKNPIIICTKETLSAYGTRKTILIGSRKDLQTVSHNLYKTLLQLEEMGVDICYCESFENDGIGMAIMNRLTRAAKFNISRI